MSASTSLKRSSDLALAGIIPFSATDWPGKLTVTAFTQGCPWACVYCHNPDLQSFHPGAHSFDEVVSLLRSRRGLIDALVISGGEPTTQAGLGSAIAAAHELGFPVGLHTCGYAPRRLAALLSDPATRPDWIGLDVKGLPADMPAVVGCTSRMAEAAWKSLEIAATSGVDLQVRTTIWPGSTLEKHLDQLRDGVSDFGQELVVQWARGVDEEGRFKASKSLE